MSTSAVDWHWKCGSHTHTVAGSTRLRPVLLSCLKLCSDIHLLHPDQDNISSPGLYELALHLLQTHERQTCGVQEQGCIVRHLYTVVLSNPGHPGQCNPEQEVELVGSLVRACGGEDCITYCSVVCTRDTVLKKRTRSSQKFKWRR